MRFQTPLEPARLIRRYKRFLADIRREADGLEVVAHCPNPGSMMGLAEPGTRIWVEPNDDPGKKLKWGWRLVDHENGHFTGIDTALANRIVKAALIEGRVPGLAAARVRAEVPRGAGSRIDFLLSGTEDEAAGTGARETGARETGARETGARETWVEVKSVTLCRAPGLAEFPDAATARGLKHLGELAQAAQGGARAVMLYLVQRTDCRRFAIAADIDPAYAAGLAAAREAGVEVMGFACDISPDAITFGKPLPFAG